MLDVEQLLHHPDVEFIWNFFPIYLFFPRLMIWLMNIPFFIPNLFIRFLYVPWNTLTFPIYLLIMLLTSPLN